MAFLHGETQNKTQRKSDKQKTNATNPPAKKHQPTFNHNYTAWIELRNNTIKK